MARPRWTSRTEHYRGPTVTVTVRVPEARVKFMDAQLGQADLHTRTDVVQDALALWELMEKRDGA